MNIGVEEGEIPPSKITESPVVAANVESNKFSNSLSD